MFIDYIYAFNISTLIANKQYSPLYATTFDLMTDAEIQAQMDLWVQDGTLPNDGIANVEKPSVTAVGKNLFDNIIEVGDISTVTGLNVSNNNTFRSVDFTPLLTNTTYTIFTLNGIIASSIRTFVYDENFVFTRAFNGSVITLNSNERYIKFRINETATTLQDKVQIELGSTATTYEPYKSSTLTIDTELRSLPNGVRDRVYEQNGEVWLEKRVEEYELESGDFASVIDRATITQLQTLPINDFLSNNMIPASNPVYDGILIPLFEPQVEYVTELPLGQYATRNTSRIVFSLPLGTTFAQAQTDLAGTKILYQLATPQLINLTQEGKVSGELIAFENGTIYNTSDTFHADISFDVASNRSAQITGLLESASYQAKQIDTKANKVQEAITEPTLLNGWVELDASSTPFYYKDDMGRCHLGGVLKDGTTSNGTVIFTIPLGYRPSSNRHFIVVNTSSNLARITVTVTGNVQIYGTAPSNAFLALDGISFKVGN
jgi:hypothetical protein